VNAHISQGMRFEAMPNPEIVGEIPDLEGLRCEELALQHYVHEGEAEPPSVLFLKPEGHAWQRVTIDAGVVFWRSASETDLAGYASDGHTLVVERLPGGEFRSLLVEQSDNVTQVVISLESRTIVLRNALDQTVISLGGPMRDSGG